MKDFRLQFDEIFDGCILMEIFAGTKEHRTVFSYTFIDSCENLIIALCNLVDGSDFEEVVWYLRPQKELWEFTKVGRQIRLDIYIEEEWREKELLLSYCGEQIEMMKTFWRALRSLESNKVWSKIEKHWNWPFPSSVLCQLKSKIDNA